MPTQLAKDHGVWALLDLTRVAEWESLETYLRRMLELCVEMSGADGATIFLLDEGTGEYVLVERIGALAKAPPDSRFKPGQGIAGVAVQREKPMLIGDPREAPDLGGGNVEWRSEIGTSMVIPLCTAHAGAFGVINIARSADRPPLGRSELSQVAALAGQIALAVSNARLFVRANVALAEARQMHDQLKSVLETVAFGVLVLGHDDTVLECNHAAGELLGSGAERGSSVAQVLPHIHEFVRPAIEEALKAGRKGERVRRRVTDEATGRAYLVVSRPLTFGGITIALEDMSEVEQTQRDLADARRLADIGQMTAAIAHEIRNPLTGIRSAAQMIRNDPAGASEFAGIIESEVVKLNSLCDEFLDFARPLQLSTYDTDLSEAVQRVLESERAGIEAAGIELEFTETSPPEPCRVDPDRLEQVLRNLLRNAVQACAPGDRIRVSVGGTVLTVEDNGAGMSDEVVANLFRPFFSTKPRGAGLGLSNVQKIVEAHGGSIHVDSKVGLGSRFDVAFRPREAS